MKAVPVITRRVALAFVCTTGLAALSPAQDSLIRFGNGVTLRAVDQGTEDVGPLARSARVSRLDLRMPTGFDRVYRLESPTLGDGAPARYARVSGALIAIFPRSEYQKTAAGTSIMVPAGTIFAIGSGSAASAVATQRQRGPVGPTPLSLRESTRLSGRLETRVEMGADAAPPAVQAAPLPRADEAAARPLEAAPAGAIWGDERYRVARVARLLDSVSGG